MVNTDRDKSSSDLVGSSIWSVRMSQKQALLLTLYMKTLTLSKFKGFIDDKM